MIPYRTNIPCHKCQCLYVRGIHVEKEITESGDMISKLILRCGNPKCDVRRTKQKVRIYDPKEVISHVEMDEEQLEAVCHPDDNGICHSHIH